MSDLHLLMVHADDHGAVMDDVPEAAARAERVAQEMPDHLWDDGGDPNDLSLQRWGVIAPAGPRGDRLLALIQPLVARRREQQGGAAIQVYRVPPKMTPSQAAVWKKTVFRAQTDLDVALPRYQLILGDLHEVPLSVQQIQGTDGLVGRLTFSRDEDYEAYADKVLRWERAPANHREGRSIFHTVHDRTHATEIGYRAMIEPGLRLARERMELGQFNADQIVDAGDHECPSPDELLHAARADRPGVLFSLSHGEGPPRRGWSSAEEQRRAQGAMSFGREGRIRAEDLAGRPFMPGGAWFMFACLGAGSPDASAYHHWLSELASVGQFAGRPDVVLAGIPRERPFIAAIPKEVLSNPNGPLAFIGHVDLAWTYSFQDLDAGTMGRPAKFVSVLRSLLRRDRFGVSFRELYRYLEQTNTELTARLDETRRAGAALDAAAVAQQAHLWMLRQDLAAYVLLGDPAARLALADPAAPARRAAAPEIAAPRPPVRLPLPIDELEEAIGKVLVGDESLKTIAAEHGVDRDELRALADRYSRAGRAALGVEDD